MKRIDNDRILIYSDLHLPYQHKDAVDFLADIARNYKPDRVLDLGDTLDEYAVSQYPKSPSADNVVRELNKAKKKVKILASIFPRVDIMESNHTDRLYRRATVGGIPREYLLPIKELMGAPKGWKWHRDLVLTINATREQVYFAHTKTGTTINLAKNLGMSVAVGHKHNSSGVQYFATPKDTHFAIDTGCLISDKGYAYSYNKGNVIRPVRSVAIIEGGIPHIIPFK